MDVVLSDSRGLTSSYQLKIVHNYSPKESKPVEPTIVNIYEQIIISRASLNKFPDLERGLVVFENVTASELPTLQAKVNLTRDGTLSVSLEPYRLFFHESYHSVINKEQGTQRISADGGRRLANDTRKNKTFADFIKMKLLTEKSEINLNMDVKL